MPPQWGLTLHLNERTREDAVVLHWWSSPHLSWEDSISWICISDHSLANCKNKYIIVAPRHPHKLSKQWFSWYLATYRSALSRADSWRTHEPRTGQTASRDADPTEVGYKMQTFCLPVSGRGVPLPPKLPNLCPVQKRKGHSNLNLFIEKNLIFFYEVLPLYSLILHSHFFIATVSITNLKF